MAGRTWAVVKDCGLGTEKPRMRPTKTEMRSGMGLAPGSLRSRKRMRRSCGGVSLDSRCVVLRGRERDAVAAVVDGQERRRRRRLQEGDSTARCIGDIAEEWCCGGERRRRRCGEKLFKKLLREKLCEPNEVTFLTVINGLCKAGQTLAARDLLMLILVDAFFYKRMVEEAEDVMTTMMQRNVCPNIVTYNALIDGYCLRGHMDNAIEGKVDEAWNSFLEIPRKWLEPTMVTYGTMLPGLFRKCRCEDGWKLFSEMQKCKVLPDLLTYNTLLHGLCRNE
ncbi:hypothetical protein BUALT_Bualt05G0070600 [Buddleja alternifolia]|uniref:Pentatricopeptide repeat-containing protein n=1 Tax=Buddleja alternifolia TaxID=168488 RepID=A0AAV6XQC2_9LAMI|nr:hypothetical protein BUALT_Bualt05G0070600 [Buddleja alternifolia]